MKTLAVVPELRGDANISVDVDGIGCYRQIHGLPNSTGNGDLLWSLGIDRAQALFSEFDLSATFFVIGRDLEDKAKAEQARALVESGHEIANHSYDHHYGLRHLPESELAYQITATDQIIEAVTGLRPVGFRTPGYNISADIMTFSRRAGHRYDASIFPCLSYWLAKEAVMQWRSLRGATSGSERTDPRTLMAPREPYFPDLFKIWTEAPSAGAYVEIPVATFAAGTLPVIGTSLHLLDTVGFERLWPIIDRRFSRFFNLEMHAIDFVDAADLADVDDSADLIARQPDLRIPWTKKVRRYRRILSAISTTRKPVTLAEATADLKT